jgi:ribosomal protein L37AE/L43A
MAISITDKNLKDTFQRINIAHVFMCCTCKKCWLTKDLYKTAAGEWVCLSCNNSVEDVTFSPLGQSFLQIIGSIQ